MSGTGASRPSPLAWANRLRGAGPQVLPCRRVGSPAGPLPRRTVLGTNSTERLRVALELDLLFE